MRKLLPLAAVSALVLALGACSKPAPEETPSPSPEPTMSPTETPTDAAEATPTEESTDRGMMAAPDANPGDRP